MIKIFVIVGAIIAGVALLNHIAAPPEEMMQTKEFTRVGKIIFIDNDQPYKSDSEFRRYVFEKIMSWKVEKMKFERGRDMTGQEIIRCAVIHLEENRNE